jgi:hypothetical protein
MLKPLSEMIACFLLLATAVIGAQAQDIGAAFKVGSSSDRFKICAAQPVVT